MAGFNIGLAVGLPDHLKFFQGHFPLVVIGILLHAYFEYFLDIAVTQLFVNS